MVISIPHPYRQPVLGQIDPRFRKCLSWSATAGVLFLAIVLITPNREMEVASIEAVPERLARLILQKPEPVVQSQTTPEVKAIAPPAETVNPDPEPVADARPESAKPAGGRKTAKQETEPTPRGEAGRAMARQLVSRELADVKGSLGAVLADLSTSLSADGKGKGVNKSRGERRRQVRAGRSAGEAGAPSTGSPAGVDVAALGGALGSSRITISSIDDLGGGAAGSGPGSPGGRAGGRRGGVAGSGSGTRGGGEWRSNSSLLAVVRKYSAGIQFCYDNELNRSPGLRGKLVVGITVAPSGNVLEATVVENTLASEDLAACAISQIRGWRFPEIPKGVVTFKAPFIFTPPK